MPNNSPTLPGIKPIKLKGKTVISVLNLFELLAPPSYNQTSWIHYQFKRLKFKEGIDYFSVKMSYTGLKRNINARNKKYKIRLLTIDASVEIIINVYSFYNRKICNDLLSFLEKERELCKSKK